jgi:hypothetical protein
MKTTTRYGAKKPGVGKPQEPTYAQRCFQLELEDFSTKLFGIIGRNLDIVDPYVRNEVQWRLSDVEMKLRKVAELVAPIYTPIDED